MQQKNISLSYGIHRSPSLGNDGELSECVNLIPKNGELVNIQPPQKLGLKLYEGEILIYVHKSSKYTNYIVKKESDNFSYKYQLLYYKNEEEKKIITYIDSEIKNITSIGNTLILLTEEGMQYILYENDTYKYIGSKIPDIELTFSLKQFSSIRYTNKDIEFNKSTFMDVGNILLTSEDKLQMENELLSMLNPILEEYREKGLFYAPFFVRYAYKTSLGDYSYISSPVLMVPNAGAFPYAEASDGIFFDNADSSIPIKSTKEEGFENLITNKSKVYAAKNITFKFNSCKLLAKVMDTQALDDLSNWSDIISSVDIFITHPYSRMSEGGDKPAYLYVHSPYASINMPFGGYMNIKEGIHCYSGNYDLSNADLLWISQIDNEEYRKKMESDGVFRLIKSINIDKINEDEDDDNITLDGFIVIDPGDLNNLDTRVALDTSYDYGSRDTLVPNYAFTYNQRLNISGIRRFPYCPPANLAFTYTNGYLDSNGNAVVDEYQYTIYAFMSDTGQTIKITSTESKLHNTPSWLFIPHANASKAIIQRTKNGISQYAELTLEKHQYLNGAFYIYNQKSSSDFFEKTEIEYTDVRPSILQNSYSNFIDEPNKIYTSETGNPFVFPLSGINTIGTGDILGISSITKALSQGQFGQFPLYVFSSDGIWAMEVNPDTGLYSSIHPISRDVCSNPKAITQIDSGIIFTTAQGLKLIQGSEVVLLSSSMDGQNTDESLFNISDEFKDLFIPDTEDFTDMLSSCSMVYDYSHSLLHIFPQEGIKHYIYSFESGEFSSYVGFIPLAIVPGYPETIVQIDKSLHTFEKYTSTDIRKGMLVTRPLAFDDPFALKVVADLRMLANRTDKRVKLQIAMFASNDGISYFRVPSLRQRAFKFYRFVIFTQMSDIDTLSGIGINYEPRRTNKLR
jgi:hypothetical protein